MAAIKLAFGFMIFAAVPTAGVRLATWVEIELKAKRGQRVPLSHRAVGLLGEAAERFGSEGLLSARFSPGSPRAASSALPCLSWR